MICALALVAHQNMSDTFRKAHCSILYPFQPYIGLFPVWGEIMKVRPMIEMLIPLIPANLLVTAHWRIHLNNVQACPNVSGIILIGYQYYGTHTTCFIELCLEVPNYPTPVSGIGHSK